MNWKERARQRELAENPPVVDAPKTAKPKVEKPAEDK